MVTQKLVRTKGAISGIKSELPSNRSNMTKRGTFLPYAMIPKISSNALVLDSTVCPRNLVHFYTVKIGQDFFDINYTYPNLMHIQH